MNNTISNLKKIKKDNREKVRWCAPNVITIRKLELIRYIKTAASSSGNKGQCFNMPSR